MSHGDPDGMAHIQAVPQLNFSNEFMRRLIYGAASHKDGGGHGGVVALDLSGI